MLWIFGRLFGDCRVDFGRPRRDGWIRAGRVRPRIAPRRPGVLWDPLAAAYMEARLSIRLGYLGHLVARRLSVLSVLTSLD